MNDSARRVAVVTGATRGMGSAIALGLAQRGMHVVTIARNPQGAAALRDQVGRTAPRGTVEVITGELSTRRGIIAAASTIAERHQAVSVLINNAGAHFPDHELTADGVERHIAIDYLAGFGLTVLLEPQLRAGHARVVNVASDTLRDTRRLKLVGPPKPATVDPEDLDDLTRLNPVDRFVPFEAYARAKLLTVTAGYDLARSLAGDVTVNAVHPGIVATDIIDDLIPAVLRPFGGLVRRTMLTPEQGASASLRLATDPALDDVTGRYFVRHEETPTPATTNDRAVQRRLRAASDQFFGLTAAR
ncbi:SDR family NAD(P)-dependent oxidoreductase [Curtobacterium sp. ISL-83]|uniref:SDR family NAD(P)-dependent oxidoreductase n=1 Tax=Curtobacterium sp. ISL-83 TaxID=2819145 RepID=UPI001BE585D6|nr:SDR family NAD(P)-dependent oxidoreductase [Curtobacterium sp. ISL-83]MBT2503573.1 SDR family NAD(P)-dependent oxidoreductase [Curtobacterium sp. ISL-83]